MVVENILSSMIEKFNYVVCSIKESNDVTTLSIDELQNNLLVHEQRMESKKYFIEEQALKISNAGRGVVKDRGNSFLNVDTEKDKTKNLLSATKVIS